MWYVLCLSAAQRSWDKDYVHLRSKKKNWEKAMHVHTLKNFKVQVV